MDDFYLPGSQSRKTDKVKKLREALMAMFHSDQSVQ